MDLVKEMLMSSLLPAVIAFAVTAALGPIFIPWLHRLKFGQEIREEGPKWHQKKSGTPTMGGIMFITGIIVAMAVTVIISAVKGNLNTVYGRGVLILLVSLGFGLVGFIDDYIKVVKKRNLGLTAAQKFLMQVVLAVIYVAALYVTGALKTDILIPFTGITWTMPVWLYVPFVIFLVCAVVNAVNLTDGLDGLASSITVVVSAFFAVTAFIAFDEFGISGLAAAVFGALLGFLIYNKYPAKVFMGDTGSLFLGAVVVLMAIDTGLHLFLILVGFVYLAETLSVIMQTAYFKYTKKKYGEGRRIFKMSPLHHHFEMCGWSEVKIVTVFTVATIILCVIAYLAV